MPGTFITAELDLEAFQAGIFQTEANLISPVVVFPAQEVQDLAFACEEPKRHPGQLLSYGGIAGIGPFSLEKFPAGLLAKVRQHVRLPTELEMKADADEYGDQVIGEEVSTVSAEEQAKYPHAQKIRIWKKEFYFKGPERIAKSVFITRIFSGPIPQNIDSLLKEIEGISDPGEFVGDMGYQFLHADKGNLKYLAFGKPEDYKLENLKDYGRVELQTTTRGKNLYYYPKGQGERSDWTAMLCEN